MNPFYLLLSLFVFTACKTPDTSNLYQDDEVKPLPTMSAEEYEASLNISAEAAENQALKSLLTIHDVKDKNPSLKDSNKIQVEGDTITIEDIPTETEVIDGGNDIANVGGGIVDQAKASLAAYFQDPQNKAVVTGATVGALSALAWNRFSQRSGTYYKGLVFALNQWTDQSIKASFGNARITGSLTKSITSTKSTKITWKYSQKFYGSMEKSLGVTGFKPAALAVASSVIASSLASFWAYSDYNESGIEEIESKDDFNDRLGPQMSKYQGRDEILEITNRYAFLLNWQENQKSIFYKAAVSDIVRRIPEIAKKNGGKITADTVIPFDALSIIERINATEAKNHPEGFLTTQPHIDHLRGLILLGSDQKDEYGELSEKDRNIMEYIDNLDTITAANFVMKSMLKDKDIKPSEKAILEKLIAENTNLMQWMSKNFD